MEPVKEYVSRRDRWRTAQADLQRRFIRIGNWRLVLGLLEAALALLVFAFHVLSGWLLLVPLLAFIVLVVWHQRVIRRRTLAERAIRYYDQRLARLEDRWMGSGRQGNEFRDPAHVFSDDLDVFGRGGLFELVASARTAAGERMLANWLLTPATRAEALARQQAIGELCPSLDLREHIALLGEDVQAEVHIDALRNWASAPAVEFPGFLRPLALLLGVMGVVTLIAFFSQAFPLWPMAAVLCCNFALLFVLRRRVARVIEATENPLHGLRILALVLERLEKERFESSRLQQLRARLEVQGPLASRRLARLNRWLDLRDSGDHFLIRTLRPVILWHEQVAMGIEKWRQENGTSLVTWLAAIAEFETLSSFAALSFDRPHWTFPVFTDGAETRFDAQALQHPLMSPSKCVPNDVKLGCELQLLIVSGSNMSGKSTLLRSVGLNTVLAWAGAPVAAKQMRISDLRPGASIRVTDSLQDNRSRFFAEITRIRQIVDLTQGSQSVLFLLDELLSGTNSRDRRIGAAGIVRKLVDSGAIGLITTHDLALAKIEQDLGARATNVHFDDQISDGKIEFDYQLRPGVVTHSNALELMRAVGLDV